MIGFRYNSDSTLRWIMLAPMLLILPACSRLRPPTPVDKLRAARHLSLMAEDAARAGRWEQANGLFENAVGECPLDEQCKRKFAEALWEQGRYEDAILQMQDVVRLSADDPDALVRYGQMLQQLGRWNEVALAADRAARMNPHLAEAVALQGHVFRQQQRYDEALEQYHRALSLRSDYREVQMSVAELYQQTNRPLRCLSTIASLTKDYPAGQEPVDALLLEGIVLKNLGRYNDAVNRLAQVKQRGVQSTDVLFHLCEARLMAGDPQQARQEARQAMEQDPNHVGVQALMARIDHAEQVLR